MKNELNRSSLFCEKNFGYRIKAVCGSFKFNIRISSIFKLSILDFVCVSHTHLNSGKVEHLLERDEALKEMKFRFPSVMSLQRVSSSILSELAVG
jgi:hypothetical protein